MAMLRRVVSLSLATFAGILVGVSTAGLEACGGNCSHQPAGAHVGFSSPLTTSDVASFTVTGACGPVPSPLCDPKTEICDASQGWEVVVPTDAAGTCAVHVVLTDGEVFDDTVTLHYASACGASGYYGDHPIVITSKILDAGSVE